MHRLPHRVLLASLALAMVGAIAAWNWLGAPAAEPEISLKPSADGGPGAGAALRPSPTPLPWTGSVLAAVVPETDGQAIALYGVGVDEQPRSLASGFDEISALSWSPDGRSLAFAALAGGNWDIYRIQQDGAGLQRLTEHPAYDAMPAWSPDGRELAFVSYRDGNLDIYRMVVDEHGSGGKVAGESGAGGEVAGATVSGEAAISRVTAGEGPAIEPTWSPDGTWIAFAAWQNGAYRIEAVAGADSNRRGVAEPAEGVDLRAPAWSPDGQNLAYVEQLYGLGRLVLRSWVPDDPAEEASASIVDSVAAAPQDAGLEVPSVISTGTLGYGWFPGGEALAVVSADRSDRAIEIRGVSGRSHMRVANLPQGTSHVAWARSPMPGGLPPLAEDPPPPAASADPVVRTELVRVPDIAVSGDRIHADLAADFAALRGEVRAAVGQDFLGTLSDLWRPLSFYSSGSAFFSWHKTGRAFDTQMEMRGPGGRRDMVLIRDEQDGRTMWRMFLRAAAQDGSIGRPLTEAGWTFAAGSGDPELLQEGGRRASTVPGGYWVDFTALAERYGWRRIPSLTQSRLDWHRDWEAIEYWHYERRDGLRWFEAAHQVYSDEHLATELHPDRLEALRIPFQRLSRLGFPSIWPPEG